jgi:hypothetical protein
VRWACGCEITEAQLEQALKVAAEEWKEVINLDRAARRRGRLMKAAALVSFQAHYCPRCLDAFGIEKAATDHGLG